MANLGELLLAAFRWFDVRLVARLHAAGFPELRRSHSLVFAHLDADGTRISEVARRAGITRQAAHQTVAELVELGLVELVPDPSNRSAKLVLPTERGRESIRVAVAAYAELEDELARRIGRKRAAELRRALEADWG